MAMKGEDIAAMIKDAMPDAERPPSTYLYNS